MQRSILTGCLLLITAQLATNHAQGENWPGWRGPRGDGTSLEQDVPTVWDGATGKNIRWKAAIPGEGYSSPIVWNDSVFMSTCIPETQERLLLCLDRDSGTIRWQQVVVTSPLESKHALNSFASGTPATDGTLVYAAFLEVDGSTVPAPNVGRARPITPGQMVVVAYDFQGRQRWLVRPGGFLSAHGFCSNPVLFDDLVIVNGDHDGESYIVALHKQTGEVAWKIPRANKIRSYATPLIRNIDGRTQMVVSGSKHIISLDPANGQTHWTIDGPTEQFVASMIYDGKYFYMAAGFPTYHVMAIRPDGTGNVTDTHVDWHVTNAKCYVPSPVLVGDYLLVAEDHGTAYCYEASTGRDLWRARMGRHFSASLVAAGGLAYFLADDGVMKVVEPGPEFKLVAENDLNDICSASPAISEGQLFIRGQQTLYCIQNLTAAAE